MKCAIFRTVQCCIPVMFCAVAATGQLVVDAAVPVHARLWNPVAGHSGSIGRKLPLQVVIEIRGVPQQDGGTTEVVFNLTNMGKTPFTLPISPHPGDLEPSDANTDYRVEKLSLYVTLGKRQDTLLSGKAELYGSPDSPASMARLAPSESLRVRTRVSLPWNSSREKGGEEILVGHAVLDDQQVRSSNGETIEDDQELGSAASEEYTPSSLQKRPH